MVVNIDGFVILLFGLICAMYILPIHAANYFMDKGDCKCIPYSKNCSVEVVDIPIQSFFYAKTPTCWRGARLCCDKSSSSRTRIGNHMDYLRGYVFRVNPVMGRNNHHALVGNKTRNEHGSSKQKVKIIQTEKEHQIPEISSKITAITTPVPLTTENSLDIEKAKEIKQHRSKMLNQPTGNSSDGYVTENGHYINVSASVDIHSSLVTSTAPKDNDSLFMTSTTVPSTTESKLLVFEVPTAEGSYFKGSDLMVETSNVNEADWVSKMSKTSVFVPVSFKSSLYGFSTTPIPMSVNDGGESNHTKEIMASLSQPQLTSPSVATINISEYSQDPELLATKTSNLIFRYSSVTVSEVSSIMVMQEVNTNSAQPISSTIMPSEISNFNISLQTTVTQVYTLITRGYSYAQVTAPLQVNLTPKVVIYPASKSPSKEFSYSLDMTLPVILEYLITTEPHAFTGEVQTFTFTQNSKQPSSPDVPVTEVMTASEIFMVTPFQSTKALSALSPVSPIVLSVFPYTHNMTSQVSLEIPLINLVSPEFALASGIPLYNENLTSLITLKATEITAVSTILTLAPEVISHSHASTVPALLKTDFFTAVSSVLKMPSWSPLTQASRPESHLYVENSPALTAEPEAFTYSQDLTLPVTLNTASLQVDTHPLFAHLTENITDVVSPNGEKHTHSNIAYESSSLFTTTVTLLKKSNDEELDYSSKSKTSSTPQDPISITVSNSHYLTSILDYDRHKNAYLLVSHTTAVSHTSAEKHASHTHTNHYIRKTKIIKSYVRKRTKSTVTESHPSSSVNREGLFTNTLYSNLTASLPKVTETGKYTSSTIKLAAADQIHDSINVVLVGARNRNRKTSKSTSIDFVSKLNLAKLQTSRSMNLENNGKATGKNNIQTPKALYIMPSSASEEEFQKFLQSIVDERQSKINVNTKTGVWNWFFG